MPVCLSTCMFYDCCGVCLALSITLLHSAVSPFNSISVLFFSLCSLPGYVLLALRVFTFIWFLCNVYDTWK